MEIKGIVWAGIKTNNFKSSVSFYKDVLGMTPWLETNDLVTFMLPNGDLIEVLGPTMAVELEGMKGNKIDFLVDDVHAAVAELKGKGLEILGDIFHDETQTWANFISPDGNYYGLTDLPIHPLSKINEHQILFYGPYEDFGFLGNWYPAPIYLKNKIWPSSEHYYQAQKFVGTDYEEICRRLTFPREAFELSRRPDVPVDKNWNQKKENVMYEAVFAKFTQNPELGEKLVATGKAMLLENSPIDNFWGIGSDKKGLNKLGKLLMQIRSELLK